MNWGNVIKRTVLVVLAGVVMLVLAALIVVRTAAFHRFVLAKIIQESDQATGGRLEIGNFAIHWSGLSIDFYNLTLHGTEPATQPALFAADHLNVGVTVVSLIRRKFILGKIVLDHPELYVRIDAQGRSNLPQKPVNTQTPRGNSAATEIFDLAIQRMAVNSGLIIYNDSHVPLSAELNNFRMQSSFDNLAREYKTSLGYNNGRFAFKDFNPIVHDAQIELAAATSGISVRQVVVTTSQSRVSASGTVSDYAHPAVQAAFQGSVQMGDLAQILKVGSLPIGNVTLNGTMHYENTGGNSFMDAVKVQGAIDSPNLLLRFAQYSADTRSVHATYRLEDGNLYVENASAELLGGRGTGTFQMLHLAGRSASTFQAALRGVSLELTSRMVLPRADRVLLLGQTAVAAEGGWTNDINNITAHANIIVTGPLQPSPLQGTTANQGMQVRRVPVNAKIDIRYDGARSSALFGPSYVRTDAVDVSLNGLLSNHSALNVAANTTDLAEVGMFVASLENAGASNARKTPSRLETLGLGGAAHFDGQMLGTLHNPRIVGQLSADNFDVEGAHWRTLTANLDASSTGITLKNASLADARQGQLHLDARVSLSGWSFTPESAISAQIAATHMSVADLQHFANVHYPVSGDLSATIDFKGSERNPSGHGSVTVTKAFAWNEPIASLAVGFQGDGNSIRSTLQVRGAAGALSATLGYSPQTKAYDIEVNTPGVDLAKVHAIEERNLGLGGKLTGSASGHGTFNDPQLAANLQIADLQMRDRTIHMAQAQFNVAQQHATFTLHSDLEQGQLQAKGDADLTGEKTANADVDIHALPMGLLLASYLPAGGPHFGGQTDIHMTVHGPLTAPARMVAHVDIPSFSVGYKSAEIATVRPIQVDYQNGVVTLQPIEMKGSGTDLNLRGSIPVKSTMPMDVSAKGTIDLAAMKGLTPDLESAGEVDLDVSGRGDLAHPMMQGHAEIKNGSLSSAAIPVGFEMLNAQMNMQGNRLDLARLSATAGGGSVSASGFMVYGSASSFNMSLAAKNVRVRYPEGVRSVVDANVQLNGAPASSVLSGRVLIDRLSFTQGFDMASFMGQFSGDTSVPNPSSFEQNLKLNISVQSAQNLNAESSQISVEGSANLNVGGTLANPVILGRASLTGGDIFFLGKRYIVQNGTIAFANPVHTEPIVNVFMNTTVQQYNITLNFVGPINRLRTNYTSTPALPPSDIINLIAFGKTAEEQATAPSTPASLGAESVLAQGVSGQVSGRIEKLAGISQLTIDPLANTSGSDPGSQIAIQQRITGSLLFTFSTNVTTTQNETVELQYQASKTISVSALRDQNGGYGLDIRIKKTF